MDADYYQNLGENDLLELSVRYGLSMLNTIMTLSYDEIDVDPEHLVYFSYTLTEFLTPLDPWQLDSQVFDYFKMEAKSFISGKASELSKLESIDQQELSDVTLYAIHIMEKWLEKEYIEIHHVLGIIFLFNKYTNVIFDLEADLLYSDSEWRNYVGYEYYFDAKNMAVI